MSTYESRHAFYIFLHPKAQAYMSPRLHMTTSNVDDTALFPKDRCHLQSQSQFDTPKGIKKERKKKKKEEKNLFLSLFPTTMIVILGYPSLCLEGSGTSLP